MLKKKKKSYREKNINQGFKFESKTKIKHYTRTKTYKSQGLLISGV